MAKQKHNTYYNENTPGSGIYYYNENGEPKKVDVGSTYSAGSGIKIENDIISVSGKYVASADSSLDGKSLILKDNKWTELIMPPSSNWLPTIKEASANSYNAATAWTNAQGYLTAHQIIPSAKWENASNEVIAHSANWNNSYTALTANSADWLKEADIAHLATKNELNTASSTLTGQTHYLSGKIDGVTADINYLSGQIDNKLDETIYASHSGKWETASDKVEASSNYWNSVYDTVNDNSAKWDSVAESANYWNLAYNEFTENSGAWNETTQKVNDSADTWNTVTAKADQEDLETLSGELETVSSFIEEQVEWLDDAIEEVSSDVKTISGYVKTISADVEKKLDKDDFTAWSAQTTAWDVDEYTGIDPIKVENHEISLTADYLSANALDNLSGNWESTYKTVETNSGKWETAYETLTSNSADWNEVSAKLNSATFATYSADIKSTIKSFSGEFVELSGNFTAHSADTDLHLSAGERVKWNSAANRVENSAAIWDTVSAKVNNTDFEEFKTSAHNELEKKLYKNAFESWSANKDYDFYSAGNGIKIENHIVSVSADYALSADVDNRLGEYYDKDEVDELIANFGGYTTATSAEPDGHPDVDKIDPRRIYLVKMASGPTSADNYKEWIYTASAWNCVGETTMDLTPYLTKEEAANTYQPSGYYVTSSTDVIKPGSAWVLVNDNDNVQWSGLDVSELGKTYVVKSTNGTIGVGSATVGNVVTYDLSGAKIVGENGVSAEYNPATNEWNVGLEDYNDIGFAKYSSSANVYTASAVVDGYTEDLNVNPTKITLDNNKILLKTGFYHVDVQTNFTIAKPDNNYYNVFVKSIPNAASITQMIDGSYAHTETVDLSFDIRITTDDTPIEISVENFKTNETFAISNLNIHEIVSMPSQIEGGAGNYQAGNGISIGNDTIAAKIGNGLEFNESNAIQVKLGKGLKFDESQGVQAVTIDSDVNEVIETVQELQESLDTKITDNYPPAMITIADLQVANQTQYAPSNGGMLIGYLFTCPITHKIYAGSNNDYKTKIGIYTKQWSGDNKKVILGIYEYQPDYVNPDTQQVGKTEALCDTGIIELQQGYAEYDVKNLGTKTTHEMKPGCFYYATIYLSYKAGDTNGITLFGAPGYNTQVNNLKPGITITNVNCIHASLYEGLDGYSPDLNFDQMGFSWQYNSYPPSSTSDPYTSQGIVEAHAAGRPYFAIRNVKIVTGN